MQGQDSRDKLQIWACFEELTFEQKVSQSWWLVCTFPGKERLSPCWGDKPGDGDSFPALPDPVSATQLFFPAVVGTESLNSEVIRT